MRTKRGALIRRAWHRAAVLILGLLVVILPAPAQVEPATVRISVLSLFHPKTLVVAATQPLALHVAGRVTILPANQSITVEATQQGMSIVLGDQPAQPAAALSLDPGSFTLEVPGKLTRFYRGALTISAEGGVLIPVVTMPTELAVASIVAAEAPPHASLEALKVQAIVSRSFLLATPSPHAGFDACDTTHCQFLRSPPPAHSPAALATLATRGIVLTWRPTSGSPLRIVRAMYARSCGGHTRARPPSSPDEYPFYAVSCDYCLRHPERWSRALPRQPAKRTEEQRLAYNRTHGWSALPSNAYTSDGHLLQGRGTGHGVGLCQLGANDMALHGVSFEAILRHFFPNTTMSQLE
jgi:peptidoglycan hydrolase-like amidase